MKRTISLKLSVSREQAQALSDLQKEYAKGCNLIAALAQENRCWNKVKLHHLTYYQTRSATSLGAQMVCNAIRAVSNACQSLKNKKNKSIKFQVGKSVHFDKRTYTFTNEYLTLNTLNKRIKVTVKLGDFQKEYLKQGVIKEAELLKKKGQWYFNVVLDLPQPVISEQQGILAIDLGENNVAATSSGKLISGGKIRHERDKHLAMRRRLQSNGSQSAKQLLKKISGKEDRRMKHVDHQVSKILVQEAQEQGAGIIVLEKLTNIRDRIKAGKRMRTRLHRWSFARLQRFIEYKAEAKGIRVVYVNPAYSSQLCSRCGQFGTRKKHRFTCSCGNQQHSDLNASQNLCRFVLSADYTMCAVNRTSVATS